MIYSKLELLFWGVRGRRGRRGKGRLQSGRWCIYLDMDIAISQEDERWTSRPGCFGRGAERSKAVSDIYFYC